VGLIAFNRQAFADTGTRSYRFYGIVTDRDLFDEKTTSKHIFVSGRLIKVPEFQGLLVLRTVNSGTLEPH
jgi:hypothetical protein